MYKEIELGSAIARWHGAITGEAYTLVRIDTHIWESSLFRISFVKRSSISPIKKITVDLKEIPTRGSTNMFCVLSCIVPPQACTLEQAIRECLYSMEELWHAIGSFKDDYFPQSVLYREAYERFSESSASVMDWLVLDDGTLFTRIRRMIARSYIEGRPLAVPS
jgi:hypothetical protein